jgi:hypothetical protein
MLPTGKTGVGMEGVTWMVKTRGLPVKPEANVGVRETVQLPGESKSATIGPQTTGVPEQVRVDGSVGRSLGGVSSRPKEVTAGLVGLS